MSQLGLSLNVVGNEEMTDGDDKYTVFLIQIQSNTTLYTVKRRYRELHALWQTLGIDTGGCPPFPGKTGIMSITMSGLKDRQKKLQASLQALIKKQSITAVGQAEILRFFEVCAPPAPVPFPSGLHTTT